MATTFAERLRWARYKGPTARRTGRVLGATTLAREVGCAQSLVSGLERNKAEGSRHNNKFAKALGVDAGWLATGMGHAPEGFSEEEARDLRRTSGDNLLVIAHGAPAAHGREVVGIPRWTQPHVAAVAESVSEPVHTASPGASAQRILMDCFMKFVEAAGPDRATAILDLMHSYIAALRQSASREDQV